MYVYKNIREPCDRVPRFTHLIPATIHRLPWPTLPCGGSPSTRSLTFRLTCTHAGLVFRSRMHSNDHGAVS